jgi:hypothetical protein
VTWSAKGFNAFLARDDFGRRELELRMANVPIRAKIPANGDWHVKPLEFLTCQG